ncbi:MAG: cytochrome c oxidase assembly protein [Aggregatilineales bacterium]
MRHGIFALIGILLLIQPSVALAHGSDPVVPAQLWSAWTWVPLTLLLLIIAWLAYDLGVRTLWQQAGRGHGIRFWQTLAYKSGLAVVFIALISPLDALSAVLFSAHMAQHLLLLIVAAPLFVMSTAPLALLWALPLSGRRDLAHRWQRASGVRRAWSILTRPLTAWLLYAAVLWVWHFQVFYQAALRDDLIHAAEHGSFLAASGLFWWALIKPGHRHARNYGVGILAVFSTGLHSSILGALLVFSTQLWYPAYAANVAPWGLTPIDDQHLAGLIMWLPMGVIYLGAAAALLIAWLNAVERAMQRREHATTRRHENGASSAKISSRLKGETVWTE